MDYLKEEMGDFLQEIHPSLKESPASTSTAEKGSLQQHLVVEALKEVTDWAKDLFDSEKSYEVNILINVE